MIRALDRFYAKHPRISFAVMLVLCFVVLYIASEADRDNDSALRLQMLSPTSKSST